MDRFTNVQKILGDTEKQIRILIQEALEEGQYEKIVSFARLAEAISELGAVSCRSSDMGKKEIRLDAVLPPQQPRTSSARPSAAENGLKKCQVRVCRKVPQAYPRFEQDSDRLIKVGWSKKRKSEYEHRVPKAMVEAVFHQLGQTVGYGKKFEIEDLFPVVSENAEEIPAYQIYATIAWLRSESAVEKKGRDGYVLRTDAANPDTFAQLWSGLTERI